MVPLDTPLLDNLRIEPTPGATTLVNFGASGDLTKRKLLPALYSLSRLEGAAFFDDYPGVLALAKANPFAILFESYRAVIYGTPDGGPALPDWSALAALLVASTILVGLTTVLFKRLEPSFAKVL